MKKKIIAVFLGIFLSLLLFEFFLRVMALNGSNRFKEKESNRPVIFCVGDSYVYGTGVHRGDDYPSILESMISNTDVLNLGEPGSNSSKAYSIIKRNIKEKRPYIVIVQTGANNGWNKKEYNYEGSENPSLKDLLYNIKTFKFLKMLLFRFTHEETNHLKNRKRKIPVRDRNISLPEKKELEFFFSNVDLSCSKKELFVSGLSLSDKEEIRKISYSVVDGFETIYKKYPDYRKPLRFFIYKTLLYEYDISPDRLVILFKHSLKYYQDYDGLYNLFLTKYFETFKPLNEKCFTELYAITDINTKDRNKELVLRKVKADLLSEKVRNNTGNPVKSLEMIKDSIRLFPDEPLFYRYYSEIAYYMFNHNMIDDSDSILSILKQGLKYSYNSDIEKKLTFIYRMLYLEKKDKEYLESSIYYFRSILKKDPQNSTALEGLLNDLIWTKDLDRIEKYLDDHNIVNNRQEYFQQAKAFDIELISQNFNVNENIIVDELDDNLMQDIKNIQKLCKKNKAKVLFLNYPFKDFKEYRYIIENTNINIVDIYSLFVESIEDGKLNANEVFLKDKHLSEKGNYFTAKIIYEYLLKKGWIADE